MTPLEAIEILENEYSDERTYTYRRFDENIRNNAQVFHRLLDLIDPDYASDALYGAGNEIKSNFDAALRACHCTTESFEDVSLTLRQDAAFVLKVFAHKHCRPQRSGYEQCIGSNLLRDRDFVLEFVNVCPRVLEYTPAFQNDLDIVLAVLVQDGAMLQFVGQDLRQTRAVVAQATAQQPLALKFAGAFCDDKELVAACVCKNGLALKFASTRLQQDSDIVYAATKQTVKATLWVHAIAETHMFATCQAIIAECASNLQYVSPEMMTRDLVLMAVGRDGMALRHAGTFKSDKEVVCRAISNNHAALMYADKSAIDADVTALFDEAVRRTGNAPTFFKFTSRPFSYFSSDWTVDLNNHFKFK